MIWIWVGLLCSGLGVCGGIFMFLVALGSRDDGLRRRLVCKQCEVVLMRIEENGRLCSVCQSGLNEKLSERKGV